MLEPHTDIHLSQDPVHGYIPFCGRASGTDSETSDEIFEREVIDSVWVQRLRQIHQLQTAWLVYPSAEHTRFQHSVGAMHLASRAVETFYPSLLEVCESDGETLPSKGYLESLARLAALLHDVGHGPFGHFFDTHYLSHFGLNHEKLGAEIIRQKLAPMLQKIRRNPSGKLNADETIDPEQIAFLILRPSGDAATRKQEESTVPLWMRLLRSLFCGLYTVDNMDFVLRDAYMTGYSNRAFDIDRLIYYSFFTKKGLTVHQKGFATLTRFLSARAELFRSVYFHRTVRAIDLALAPLFEASRDFIFPGSGGTGSGNPLENLDEYQKFSEWSLLVDVARWDRSPNEKKRWLAPQWRDFLGRKIPLHLVSETTVLFDSGQQEQTSIYSSADVFRQSLVRLLPDSLKTVPIQIDIARHLHRPDSHLPTANLNFLFDPTSQKIRKLEEEELFRHTPQSYRICRVYTEDASAITALAQTVQLLIHPNTEDDETNM